MSSGPNVELIAKPGAIDADTGVRRLNLWRYGCEGTRASVQTWANEFGVWHVRVSRTAASPLVAARRALRNALMARESRSVPTDRQVYMRPERVPDLDTAKTIVYREGHPT